jgi:hypothetical protein
MKKKMLYLCFIVFGQMFYISAKQVLYFKNLTSSPLIIINSCNLATSGLEIPKSTESSEPIPYMISEELTPQEAAKTDQIKIETNYRDCLMNRTVSPAFAHKNCEGEKLTAQADMTLRVQRLFTDTCDVEVINKANAKRTKFTINPFTFGVSNELRHGGLMLDYNRNTKGEVDITSFVIRENGK